MSENFRRKMYPLSDKLEHIKTDSKDTLPLSESKYLGSQKYNNPYCTWRPYKLTELPLWKAGWLPESEQEYNQKISEGIKQHNIEKSMDFKKFEVPKDFKQKEFDELKQISDVGSLKATWLGHASVLIQFSNGINCLVDPLFSRRCSPVQFSGPKRNINAPVTVKNLKENGVDIHVVCISHNHHDHLDKNTIADLKKYFPEIQFIVPKNTKKKIGSKHCTELTWWQSTNLVIKHEEVKITAVPAQHWTQRNAIDERKSLWAGYVIESADASCYFVGDSGYCRAFQDIGERFPNITLALIPIGAYKPRWFMNPQHMSPEEAVQVFRDLGCRNALGIHWLTFDLADDRGVEPVKELELFKIKAKLGSENLATTEEAARIDRFVVTSVGETKSYSFN